MPDIEQDYELPEEEETAKTFKDFLAEDIDDVFFCLDEFAETHNIDGKDIPIVIEADTLKEKSAHWEAGAKQNFDTGQYTDTYTLYIKIADYGPAPKVGKKLVIDGNKDFYYRVKSCGEEAGVYLMKAERVRM